MGLRVLEATKAWRIRRTRGDITRRRRRAVAVPDFFFGVLFDFVLEDFLREPELFCVAA